MDVAQLHGHLAGLVLLRYPLYEGLRVVLREVDEAPGPIVTYGLLGRSYVWEFGLEGRWNNIFIMVSSKLIPTER
jgi:hypothetical protein